MHGLAIDDAAQGRKLIGLQARQGITAATRFELCFFATHFQADLGTFRQAPADVEQLASRHRRAAWRSEEHTSELQSLMRISYAVFCLKKKKLKQQSIQDIY